ncbi:MAG TPA: hypothetical protein VFK96_04670 [Gammaproteobacteria bacterium]|nr:hypothetical protein [Gammaproteobacteria bacterium]
MAVDAFRRHSYRAAGAALVLLTGSLALVPQAAYAGYNIYSPHVELGETEVEARGYFNQDNLPGVDGTGAFKFAIGHSFTSFWASELYLGEFEREASGNTHLESVEWENRFQLTPQGKYWADFGLLAEFEFATEGGHPNELKIGPLIEKSFGRTVATVNLYLERKVGAYADSGTEFGYAARVRYRLNPYFEPAIEAYGSPGEFGDFLPKGEQRHQIGPGFYGQAYVGSGGQKIKYSAAALYGITDVGSPNWTFVVRMEYEFY